MHRVRTFLYCSLFWASAAGADAAQPVEVRLRPKAVCREAIVRLAEVADLNSGDTAVARDLGGIALVPAPAPGSSRELSRQDVRQLVVASGIDAHTLVITGSESIALEGAAAVDLASGPTTPSDIRNVAAEVEIIPAGKRQLRPQAYPERPKTPRLPQPAPPRLVERGAALTVYSRAAGVQITASGKALGHGAMGETIAVELSDSRQRILATIVAPQTVVVGGSAAGTSAPLTTSPKPASPAFPTE